MAALSAIHSKLRTLDNISVAKAKSRQVSVVYFDEVNGERVIDWPPNPAPGVLAVPKKLTIEEWEAMVQTAME